MTNLVPSDQIEQIVGARRHSTKHIGRWVTEESTFYILHSRACKDSISDLRDCGYSAALDHGAVAENFPADIPVPLALYAAQLIPAPDRIVLLPESIDLTSDELENLAPGCIPPQRTERHRELLEQINAHHNKGYATGGVVGDE